MNTTVIASLSVCLYLASAFLIARNTGNSQRLPVSLAWSGASLHAFSIAGEFQRDASFNFSFVNTSSLTAMIVALLLLIAAINKPVIKLGVVVFPIAGIMLALASSLSVKPHPLHIYNWKMSVHILTSVVAFSLLNIAALQAILLAIQDQQLKSHPPKQIIQSLPPLQTMESLLFQILGTGLIFLSLSLVSGYIFIENLFAQHLVHKTVLSIVAWIIFSSLLIGRVLYGWRGIIAVRWTLAGFSLLLLAYFGSKMVLELILHKS